MKEPPKTWAEYSKISKKRTASIRAKVLKLIEEEEGTARREAARAAFDTAIGVLLNFTYHHKIKGAQKDRLNKYLELAIAQIRDYKPELETGNGVF